MVKDEGYSAQMEKSGMPPNFHMPLMRLLISSLQMIAKAGSSLVGTADFFEDCYNT